VQHGSYSHGLPGESGEFHFISLAIPMYVHNGANVTGLQALSGNIARQHYGIVFFGHTDSKEYAVMSRGAIWPASCFTWSETADVFSRVVCLCGAC
jgi:hypothetical protein